MTEFRVDLLDSTGARMGDGPLDTVQMLEDTKSLDAIGSLTFAIPAEDERAQYITAGAQFDAYDRVDGYLGRFYYKAKKLDAQAQGGARLIVQAHDQLIELARQSVHFRLTYTAQAVDLVIADLVALVSGWSDTTDASIGTTSVMYEGESILRAVDVLRDRWNKHYRLGNTRVLEFGAFGADSGVVLTNLKGQVQAEIDANRTLALVEKISLVEEADEIYNKLIPLGAGQGVSQLTIETATQGAYPVQTGVNENGSNYFYVEDAASVTNYGRRERILTLPQIRPITNSDANILNAANALKLSAEAYLARHLVPRVTYAVTVRALRTSIRVGDLVRLQYRGIVDNYAYINVDETFYVMDVVRSRLTDGSRVAQLTIASIAERRTADTDLILDVLSDLRALKINVPITLTYNAVGPYVQRVDPTHDAEFTVRIGAEVTFLNYAILRFRTSPLKSSVTTVSTDAGSTPTSGSSSASSSGASSATTTSNGGSSSPTSGPSSASSSAGGSSHSHSISIAANDVSSTGASSDTTSGGPSGFSHTHETHLVNGTSGNIMYYSSVSGPQVSGGGDMLSGTPLGTDDAHTHEMPHTHGISHGHTGSTGGSESSHTHAIAHTHSVTISSHDHNMPHTHNIAHTHSVTIPSHNHTLTYGIYQDTAYPRSIDLAINSVDVTAALGGPWKVGDNSELEIELDVTAYLVNAVGGLRQNHRIKIGCAFGQGEVEAEVDMLASIQSIAVV